MGTEETTLTRKVMTWLKTAATPCWLYKTSDKFTCGIPDIIGCVRGRLVAIEIKTDSGRLSAIQKVTLDLIKKAGGYSCVIVGDQGFSEFKNKYLQEFPDGTARRSR